MKFYFDLKYLSTGYLSGSEHYFSHTRCVSHNCGLDLRDNEKPDWKQVINRYISYFVFQFSVI